MPTFHTGGQPAQVRQVEVIVDQVEKLDASVRALLHEANVRRTNGEVADDLVEDLARLRADWKVLQARIQQIFMLLHVIQRALD